MMNYLTNSNGAATSLRLDSRWAMVAAFSLLLGTIGSTGAGAQTPPPSQRFTINLAAGVPQYVGNSSTTSTAPQSQWWFENTRNSTTYSSPTFVESSDTNATWTQVGLPYDANIPRTFINQTSGGGAGSLDGQQNWYRLHFKVAPAYASQKFTLDIEGAHTAVQVFINGTLLPGVSAVAADAQATHVVGFVPVVVDLSPYLHTDGATDNVIAIDVSRGDPWFETPSFCGVFRFGQAMAGLFRNVTMYVTNPVHIPPNVYSNQKTWGTYVGTLSEVPASSGTATAASAVVEVQTNVVNQTTTAQQVTLTTEIVDENGNIVVTAPAVTQSVPAMTPGNFPSTATPMFEQQITVPNPTLWYPNNSIYGKPYMYTVNHIVSVNSAVVDVAQSPLGIRLITWDTNFPYFNGHQTYLWGGASRYDYPALGSSVPDEQWWRDLSQIAAGGGNVWRVGHCTSSEEFVQAADAYGIMIDQPSGDGEGNWNAGSNPSADDLQLKQEIHRDMIIRDRSHPSILDWELDNGGMNTTLANELATIETTWDNINPREQADRTYLPAYAYIDECDGAGCEIGNKNTYPNNPAFGAEYWDNVGTGRGLAWDYELAFAAPYVDDWRRGRAANTFGMAQWYFADSPGEVSLWAEYQNDTAMVNFVRSLGYSEVDMNRFPRALYYIYQANWTPYAIQPVVHLAHHWNRAYEYTAGTPLQENAFSNCPKVRLLINGLAKDPVTGAALADQTPNPWTVNSSSNLTQSTTVMPAQVHWMVNWAAGSVTAECLDSSGDVVPGASDTRTTAGPETKIVLTAVPEVIKPNGTSFEWTANGSDAAFVQAEVEDGNGNIVPTAADNVTFAVTGPATYMGGSEQLVADPSWTNYYQDAFSQARSSVIGGVPYAFFHAPGDPELNFEGGLTKIALRSTFTPGTVTVTATAPGLTSGSVTLTSVTPGTTVTCGTVPAAPTGLTAAAASSSSISLSWAPVAPPANCAISSYSVYSGAGGLIASGLTGTAYTNTGLAASTTYTYYVKAVDSKGASAPSSTASASTSAAGPSCSAVPAAPTGLTATAASSSSINLNWTAVTPPANCTISSYSVYSSTGTLIAGGLTSTTYGVTGLAASTTYTYYVKAVDADGSSAASSQASAATLAAGSGTDVVSINAGGPAVSNSGGGDNSFVADEDFSAGGTYTTGNTVTTAGVTSAAPMAVYQSERSGVMTYTIPGLTAGSSYTVLLHFAEIYFTAAGKRVFNVAINGTTVLTNLDIYATVGANKALVKPFNATANSSGQIVISFTNGTADQPKVSGIEVLGAGGSNCSSTPNLPETVTATANSSSQISVSWGTSTAGAGCTVSFSVYRSTTSGFTPSSSNKIASGVTPLSYVDTGLAASTTYYYVVEAADSFGSSGASAQASATTQAGGGGGTDVLDINSGGPAVGAYAADENFVGGSATTFAATVSTTGLTNPAPEAVYQTQRAGNFTYTLPGLTAGGSYAVRLHFSEGYWTAAGKRVFNVSINGTQVLTNFDIFAAAGGGNIAVVEQFTATANASGQVVIAFTTVTDNAAVNGIEIATSGGTPVVAKPTFAPAAGGYPSAQNVTISDATAGATIHYTTNGTTPTASSPVYSRAIAVSASETIEALAVLTGDTNSAVASAAYVISTGSGTDVLDINSGGAAVGAYAADENFVGGTASTFTATVSTTGVTNPAPEAVYQTQRFGNFTYTLAGLTAGHSYTVRLHFAEGYWTAPGKRVFNVSINGAQVLTNFDIFAAAGGENIAVVEQFTATANASGQIVIVFTTVNDNAAVNGIEIVN